MRVRASPRLSTASRMSGPSSGEVEEEQLAGTGCRDLDGGLVLQSRRVTLAEGLAVDHGRARHEVEPRAPARGEGMAHGLAGREQRGVHARVLMDAHRALARVVRGDEPQAPALFRRRELLLLVAGREVARLGEDPDLEEMHRLV